MYKIVVLYEFVDFMLMMKGRNRVLVVLLLLGDSGIWGLRILLCSINVLFFILLILISFNGKFIIVC